jgi:4-deoxy-L-threo-5-hexosulose-uronate ketol-isomerase
MEVRYASNARDFATFPTERVREEFLVQNLFVPGQMPLVYSHYDRMIVGGAHPTGPLALGGGKELGTGYFLERREMGVINVGPAGSITVDGQKFDMERTDCLYIGKGAKEVVFDSADAGAPAKFYILSGPAHAEHPTAKTTMAECETLHLGSPEESNVRNLTKMIHGGGLQSCNLVMGITSLESGSVWNSMPCHTHDRRMEAYFYFDLPESAIMMHFMGEPSATRNIVMRNEEAVLSPPWSIHAGCGTSNYTFIWGMVGDNQEFTDMDAVDLNLIS